MAASTVTATSDRARSASSQRFRQSAGVRRQSGDPRSTSFRGAIQGDYDHGVFMTTSRFTRDAKQASYKKGAITVLLLDGPAIADLLVERGLGVKRQPLYLYDLDNEFFDINDS